MYGTRSNGAQYFPTGTFTNITSVKLRLLCDAAFYENGNTPVSACDTVNIVQAPNLGETGVFDYILSCTTILGSCNPPYETSYDAEHIVEIDLTGAGIDWNLPYGFGFRFAHEMSSTAPTLGWAQFARWHNAYIVIEGDFVPATFKLVCIANNKYEIVYSSLVSGGDWSSWTSIWTTPLDYGNLEISRHSTGYVGRYDVLGGWDSIPLGFTWQYSLESMETKHDNNLFEQVLAALFFSPVEAEGGGPNQIDYWWFDGDFGELDPEVDLTIYIFTPEELQAMEETNVYCYNYELMNDLDMTGYDFIPISFFSGSFDGNGYTISNLTINSDNASVGLFGVTRSADISNVILENVNIVSTYPSSYCPECTGGLIGYGENTIVYRCSVSGSVTAEGDEIGGLIGYLKGGDVQQCFSSAMITGDEYSAYIGGFIGRVNSDGLFFKESVLKDCYATGTVNFGVNADWTGGFAGGLDDGDISNCYSSGSVGTNSIGSLIGGFSGGGLSEVENCFWDIQSSGQAASAAGTGKTTAEMQTQSTFTDWDFDTIWHIPAATAPFSVTKSLTMILPVVLVSLLALGSIRMALGGQMDVVMLILMGITTLLVIVGADVIAGMISGWDVNNFAPNGEYPYLSFPLPIPPY